MFVRTLVLAPAVALVIVAALTSQACQPAATPVVSMVGARPRPPAPVCHATAPVYITIRSEIANTTGRPTSELDVLVRRAMMRKLTNASGIVFANGAHAEGRCEISVAVRVGPLDHGGGKLRVVLQADVFGEPAHVTLGDVKKTLTKADVPAEDRASEDELIDLASGLAIEQIEKHIHEFTDGEAVAVPDARADGAS